MKTEIKKSELREHLEGLSNSDLVNLWNVYCQENNCPDDEIYCNDEEFFSIFFDNDVIGAVRAASYGDFNFSHDYVCFNGYANLDSFNDPNDKNSPFDISSLVDAIEESPENYDIEFEDEEDEEDEDDYQIEDEKTEE